MGIRFATGCVSVYVARGCGGPDLPQSVPEGGAFRSWYILSTAKNVLIFRWDNGDVWGSDFRDAGGGDLDTQGGADYPDLYYFSGHGSCQGTPTPTSPDFLITCGNFGKPDTVNIGAQSRFGNGFGHLRFLFLDASCPMDLVSLTNTWFPVFQGLHVAIGHSGNANADALDTQARGDQLGAYTAGFVPGFNFIQLSIGDAWMRAGIIDIQSGCSAVVVAAGATREEAEDRRDHERVQENRPNPVNSWLAWRWVTRG
jgi:hypothetical protein